MKRGDQLVFRGGVTQWTVQWEGDWTWHVFRHPPPSLRCLAAFLPSLLLCPISPPPPFGVPILAGYLLKLALSSAAPLSSPVPTHNGHSPIPSPPLLSNAQPGKRSYGRFLRASVTAEPLFTSAIEGLSPSLSPCCWPSLTEIGLVLLYCTAVHTSLTN